MNRIRTIILMFAMMVFAACIPLETFAASSVTTKTSTLSKSTFTDRYTVTVNSAKGMQKITIGLTPESLGKLVIEIAKGENGLSANILTDNAQAKELLYKNLDVLKNALQSQGVSVNNVNVKVAEAGRSSDSDNNMYRENEAQFDSNGQGGNSKNSEDTNKEKRSEYEFNQSNVASQEIEMGNDVAVQTQQTEKTVSIKGGLGNIKYKV